MNHQIIMRMTKKETYINTLIDSMSMEDFRQYVRNDMADFLCYCSDSEVINEFLIKVEHTTDEQFYNKFVKLFEPSKLFYMVVMISNSL